MLFFIIMNVLRTCKLLSRLGQSTVGYLIFLTFVIVCFYCSAVLPKDVSLLRVVTHACDIQIYMGRLYLCAVVPLANGPTGTDWQFDKASVNAVRKFGM